MGANSKVASVVMDAIKEALAKGDVPWAKPWTMDGSPRSLAGRPYSGVNRVLLATHALMAGVTRPVYVTPRAAMRLGARIDGAETVPIVYFRTVDNRYDVGDSDNPTDKRRTYALMRYYRVLPAESVGLLPPVQPPSPAPGSAADTLLKRAAELHVPVIHAEHDRACYVPGQRRVIMPTPESFARPVEYVQTLAHELAHAVIHADGVERHGYADEETVAETAAMLTVAMLGETPCVDNGAAYVAGWYRRCTDRPGVALSLLGRAQRVADAILGFTAADRGDETENDES